MTYKKSIISIVAIVLFWVSSVWAVATRDLLNETLDFKDGTSKQLTYLTGNISLINGLASLSVPEEFKYLGPEDTKFVLEDLYGNDPADTLGMLLPIELKLTNEENPREYFVDISWYPEGYISDKDATSMDYSKVLETLKAQVREANNDPSTQVKWELLGWIEQPSYDQQKKILYFGKDFHFFTSTGSTLNYNIQFLARKGYAQLNLVTDPKNLEVVKKDFPSLLGSIVFAEWQRYEDYNETTDTAAEYGLNGLLGVAGVAVVAKKVGIFVLLAKFWKILFVGIIMFFKPAINFIKRTFRKEPTLSAENTAMEPVEETGDKM